MSTRKYLGENGTREIVGMVHDNAENISDLADITAGLVGIVENPCYDDTNELIAALTSGAAMLKSHYGDILTVSRTTSDGVTKEYKWEVIGKGEDGTNTLTLQLYRVWDELMTFGEEALAVFPNGLAVGNYRIDFPDYTRSCVAPDSASAIYIHINSTIPAGAQLVALHPMHISGYEMAKIQGIKFYASAEAVQPISNNTVNPTYTIKSSPTDGITYTELGTADGNTEHINHISRACEGAVYLNSDTFEWLNSDQPAANRSWVAKNEFSRKPSQINDGFLYGWEPWFLAIIKSVVKRTYTYSSVVEKTPPDVGYQANVDVYESNAPVFLPCLDELGERAFRVSAVSEGTLLPEGTKYGFYDVCPTVRFDNEGNARSILTRTVEPITNTNYFIGPDDRYIAAMYKLGITPCVVIGVPNNTVQNTSIQYMSAADNAVVRANEAAHAELSYMLKVSSDISSMYVTNSSTNLSYSNIRYWYINGFIDLMTVKKLRDKGKITQTQYEHITGIYESADQTLPDDEFVWG